MVVVFCVRIISNVKDFFFFVKLCLERQTEKHNPPKRGASAFVCCSLILLIAQGKDLSALVNLPQPQYKAPRSLFPCLAHRIKLSCHSNRQHRESLVQLSCLTDRHFSPIMGVCRHRPASIDTVSGLRGDALISEDTLNIDLTSCRNDPLVLVKDHCLSRLALMHLECRIVMETIITSQACAAGQELCSDYGELWTCVFACVCVWHGTA